MKYIAIPIDVIETVIKISAGEVNRYEDIIKNDEEKNGVVAHIIKAKWEGRVEALEDLLRFGTECNKIE